MRGPFDRAGSLTDPQPGEHYRVVLADGWCGDPKRSRMDAYSRADMIRDIWKDMPLGRSQPESIGIVRVIPRTTSLAERMQARLEAGSQARE